MVANIDIQMSEYLSAYSLFDVGVATVILALILILGIYYFSESKKKVVQSISPPEETSASSLSLSPQMQITIIFQKDLSDDEEISKEIADMYISNRVYYYAGKEPPCTTSQVLSEKYDDAFVEYESIDFPSLNKIDI